MSSEQIDVIHLCPDRHLSFCYGYSLKIHNWFSLQAHMFCQMCKNYSLSLVQHIEYILVISILKVLNPFLFRMSIAHTNNSSFICLISSTEENAPPSTVLHYSCGFSPAATYDNCKLVLPWGYICTCPIASGHIPSKWKSAWQLLICTWPFHELFCSNYWSLYGTGDKCPHENSVNY